MVKCLIHLINSAKSVVHHGATNFCKIQLWLRHQKVAIMPYIRNHPSDKISNPKRKPLVFTSCFDVTVFHTFRFHSMTTNTYMSIRLCSIFYGRTRAVHKVNYARKTPEKMLLMSLLFNVILLNCNCLHFSLPGSHKRGAEQMGQH